MLWRQLLYLSFMNQPLLAWSFCSAASSDLSAFKELKRDRAFLYIRFCLKGMLWLAWSSVKTTKTFSVSARRLFCFLIICVFTAVALLISFKNFSFAFTPCLTVWCKRPTFWPISAFDMPSSLTLIIYSFWFKVRDEWLFVSLEHLEAIVGLLIGLILILFCLRE